MSSTPSSARALVVAVLVLLVGFSAAVRVRAALADPNFDAASPEGMLKSDPALLYYVTERILGAGGGVPEDFRADPRVQHPGVTDVPAEFTVGQEFLVAWAYRAFGGETPLHVFCVRFMAWTASLAALGVFLLARVLTGRSVWALFATALFVLAPANYRTIGFVLVREDLALPLFALHLGLVAGAARRPGAGRFLAAGLAAGAALSTWHAMGFVFAVEAACLWAWFLRRGESPFAVRGAWAVLVGPVVAATLVPALRAQGTLLSLPLQLAFALLAVRLVRLRLPGLSRVAGIGAGVAALAVLLLVERATAASSGYAHVWDVLVAKLAHGGAFPTDPSELSFDARLLWQGPFATLDVAWAARANAWMALLGLPALALAVPAWRRGSPFEGLLGVGVLASLVLAWLFARLLVLPGLLLPVAAAVVVARFAHRRGVVPVACVALLLQASTLLSFVRAPLNPWYLPPARQAEIAALVEEVRAKVPAGAPIAADFMNSTALLAHTGHPIVLQPKYETDRSRRRAEAFLLTFFHGSPAELHALVTGRFACRYLLVDRYTLGELSRATAGLAPNAPLPPGSAAEVFLSEREDVLRGVPGFELVYRSPESIRRADGRPSDFFRLYRLE